MCFLSLRERHVSSQFDDFSQRIHPSFTNVHRLIASRSLCSLCAHILPRQTPFHFYFQPVEIADLVGDEGAGRLAGVLGQYSSITKLNLAGNGIGDDGAGVLAGVLGEGSSLAMLDVGYGVSRCAHRVGDAIQYGNPHAAALQALSPWEIRRRFNEFRLERGWYPLSEPRYSPPCTPD